MPRKEVLVALLLFIVEVGIVFVGVDIVAGDQGGISLEDVVNYPENYLAPGNDSIRHNEFYAEFTVLNVSEPAITTDWYGNEWEVCVVIIKDTYDYELPFYISSDEYQNYTLWVGKSAPFKLSVGDGPYYESWSFALLINRIAYKAHDNYDAAYSVYIYLGDPVTVTLVVDAGPDQTVGVGTTVTFNASASQDPDGTIVSYFWDFGDGSNGTGVTTTHAYTELGTYIVTLTVRDAAGNSDTDTMTVTVKEIAAEGFPWWIAGIVGVIVTVGIAPVALTLRRRRAGKLQETGVVID